MFAIDYVQGWSKQASCLDQDPELFFSASLLDRKEAMRICHTCPVEIRCLDEAIENNELHGVFGGMLPKHRYNLRQERLSLA